MEINKKNIEEIKTLIKDKGEVVYNPSNENEFIVAIYRPMKSGGDMLGRVGDYIVVSENHIQIISKETKEVLDRLN